jgi:hypothetical protein
MCRRSLKSQIYKKKRLTTAAGAIKLLSTDSVQAAHYESRLFLLFRGMSMRVRRLVERPIILGMVAFTLLSGCGRSIEPQVPPAGLSRIQKLATVCREYAVNQKKQPSTVEELKAWAKKQPKSQLTWLGIEDVDQAFVSPRDQQPYVLVRGAGQKMGPLMVLAYEKTGENGKRYVVTTTGSVLELEEKPFQEVMANAR